MSTLRFSTTIGYRNSPLIVDRQITTEIARR
jgi:hypothetical protein